MTLLAALLGDPVEHSLSPAMQNAAFKALDLDLCYVSFKVDPARFAEALKGLGALGAVGANVTVPHKERAFGMMDAVSPEAVRCGAVNVVTFEEGGLMGSNTDVGAIRGAIKSLEAPRGRALLLGSGGAARAAAVALVDEGFGPLWVAVRHRDRGLRFAEDIAERNGIDVPEVVPMDALPEGWVLAVNATPLGLPGVPYPKHFLEAVALGGALGGAVLDLVYAPGGTPFAAAVPRPGCRGTDGREVLWRQGAASFERFTGCPAPEMVMRAALGLGSNREVLL